MEPEQGKYGLWYAAGVGFATKEQAEAHLLQLQAPSEVGEITRRDTSRPRHFLGYSAAHWISAAVAGVLFVCIIIWMKNGTSDASQPRASMAQINECKDLIMERVNNPSTLDLHMFSGLVTDMKGEGSTARVRLDFDASNAFGVESAYRALCQFAPGKPKIIIFDR